VSVSQFVVGAFRLAATRFPELHENWVRISYEVGGLLPNSLLLVSIQRAGELDLVLRCMEDDFPMLSEENHEVSMFGGHYQVMLSELWIGTVYEIVRAFDERKLVKRNDRLSRGNDFEKLNHDLRMLRIPLEKYQIAADNRLSEPLILARETASEGEFDRYSYVKGDSERAHIVPTAISTRGSVAWQVIDIQAARSYWLERRALSERFVSLWVRHDKGLPAQAEIPR